jgi:hypothetical protein
MGLTHTPRSSIETAARRRPASRRLRSACSSASIHGATNARWCASGIATFTVELPSARAASPSHLRREIGLVRHLRRRSLSAAYQARRRRRSLGTISRNDRRQASVESRSSVEAAARDRQPRAGARLPKRAPVLCTHSEVVHREHRAISQVRGRRSPRRSPMTPSVLHGHVLNLLEGRTSRAPTRRRGGRAIPSTRWSLFDLRRFGPRHALHLRSSGLGSNLRAPTSRTRNKMPRAKRDAARARRPAGAPPLVWVQVRPRVGMPSGATARPQAPRERAKRLAAADRGLLPHRDVLGRRGGTRHSAGIPAPRSDRSRAIRSKGGESFARRLQQPRRLAR